MTSSKFFRSICLRIYGRVFNPSLSIAGAILKEDMFYSFVMKTPLPSSQSRYDDNVYS
ncbi:MAG TPA: hypothetical protein VE573_07080 [Nitrososphaeraceae archaeon]|nr:hypothetical protein [Nitrososphaeraceae archaeon]